MPGGDRMGPEGMGPMSGRGRGLCAGSGVPGYMNPGRNRGFGYGFRHGYCMGPGMAWGRQRRWNMPAYADDMDDRYLDSPADEEKFLKSRMVSLKKQLKIIENRLDEMNSQKGE